VDRTDFCEKVGGERCCDGLWGQIDGWIGLEQGCLGERFVGGRVWLRF